MQRGYILIESKINNARPQRLSTHSKDIFKLGVRGEEHRVSVASAIDKTGDIIGLRIGCPGDIPQSPENGRTITWVNQKPLAIG